MKLDKKALVEAAKEVGRLVLFAALAVVVDYGLRRLSGLDQTELVVVLGTALLKLADKYIHESKYIKSNGLTDVKMYGLKK